PFVRNAGQPVPGGRLFSENFRLGPRLRSPRVAHSHRPYQKPSQKSGESALELLRRGSTDTPRHPCRRWKVEAQPPAVRDTLGAARGGRARELPESVCCPDPEI